MAERTPNGLLIKQIHDQFEKQSNNALRDKDLTMAQVFILIVLQKAVNQQLSMKELERHIGVAQSTIAGIISRLEQKGLVETFRDTTDKRIKLVHITPAGEACCAEADCHMNEADQMLLQGFSKEEQEMFNVLLTKAANNLK